MTHQRTSHCKSLATRSRTATHDLSMDSWQITMNSWQISKRRPVSLSNFHHCTVNRRSCCRNPDWKNDQDASGLLCGDRVWTPGASSKGWIVLPNNRQGEKLQIRSCLPAGPSGMAQRSLLKSVKTARKPAVRFTHVGCRCWFTSNPETNTLPLRMCFQTEHY